MKKKKNLSALSKLRLEAFTEGKAAQILYVGPFSEEGSTIENIHSLYQTERYKVSGKHHEIYLSDITKNGTGQTQDDYPAAGNLAGRTMNSIVRKLKEGEIYVRRKIRKRVVMYLRSCSCFATWWPE